MIFDGERCIIGVTDKILTKHHLDRYEFASKFVKNKKVLDIACGTGYGSALLKKSGATEVIGIDISEEAISHAKNNYSGPQINFLVGDATNIKSVEDRSIDIIISYETIEHIKEYEVYLLKMHRVLKEDGLFIISTPNKKFSSPNTEKPSNLYHYIEFYLDGFQSILEQHFSKVTVHGQNYNSSFFKFKRKCSQLIPIKVRSFLFSKAVREIYNKRELTGITKNDVINCDYFIAICKK